METQAYAERGYLLEDFRLFHLRGAMEEQLDWHYHTFHKLVFFLGGSAGYGVEGRSFRLERGVLIGFQWRNTRCNSLFCTLRKHNMQRVAFRQDERLACNRIAHIARPTANYIEFT